MYLFNILADWQGMIEEGTFDEYIQHLLNQYQSLGPLPGIILPFLEAFLPVLPLFVFVFANAAAYGLFWGFFYSWIGACLGAVCVFFVIRYLGDKALFRKIRYNKQIRRVTAWLERHGFGPLFLLLCFPFSPSSIINVVAGLSNINFRAFGLAVLLGKSVMIFSIAYVGSSIVSFAKNPVKSIVVAACIGLFWLLGKYIENRLKKKTESSSKTSSYTDYHQTHK
ncbi:TVP38/TMEM64 family protein [Virgibacillus sp. 179-BFC.A HS]|uniref:TVP38/TMEM64 family membrane protein n=1 Tax=Tigheibacillus jepli TaxID=3035914 RepID=A0ABU5CK39_9BACI|nr:TVP38/TMEM64 family protein [Virgibacillus sp. 179-BFC.A HS]MDY0406212.1 TVP38/TMEM64 family protein [Virgibacillus sp. 179-BFC.A HS]